MIFNFENFSEIDFTFLNVHKGMNYDRSRQCEAMQFIPLCISNMKLFLIFTFFLNSIITNGKESKGNHRKCKY